MKEDVFEAELISKMENTLYEQGYGREYLEYLQKDELYKLYSSVFNIKVNDVDNEGC